MPDDVRDELVEHGLMETYRERPHYQRNDYLGWISRAKRPETREKRLRQMLEELQGEFDKLEVEVATLREKKKVCPKRVAFSEDGSLLDLTEESPASNQYMTYELTAGGAYGNVFDAAPDAFNWATTTVDFQLLASEAPTTVANFMTYVTDGVYENTIIHRSDVDVVQAGGTRFKTNQAVEHPIENDLVLRF